tara:strand:- start:77 stop:1390 length:1314 start_codon:yes stop_codon:yes gene_type:complete
MHNFFLNPFKLLLTDRSLPFDITFFSLILIFIPFVLITGPALPDIFLSLIAFYFLIKSFLIKNWNYYKNPVVIGFLIFSLYGIIRSLFSDMPMNSLSNEGSMFYFRYIFFAMGVWYLLDNNPYLSRCLLIILIICLSVVCLDGLYQYFVGENILGNKKHGVGRLTGFFGKEPILGRYIAYLSMFTFALIYQNFQKSKKMILLSVTFLVICEVVVFLTGERAPFFFITLFTVLLIIYIPEFRIYRIIGVVITIILILGAIELNPSAKKRMIDYTLVQISETRLPLLPYSKAHEEHYISALKMFKDSPVFGVGTNTYRFKSFRPQFDSKTHDINSHPHNFYFQVLAELGFFGFLFLGSFFIYLSIIGLRQLKFVFISGDKKKLPFEYLLFPMILFVYWWPFIPNMSLYNNWNNVLMMLPLGFFLKHFYGGKANGNFRKT